MTKFASSGSSIISKPVPLGVNLTELMKYAVSPETKRLFEQSVFDSSRSSSDIGVNKAISLEDRIYQALAGAKILTSMFAMHLDNDWRRKLFSQLDSLHDPIEWEEGDKPIQKESFITFLRLWLFIRPARRPGLGLSFNGNLIAAWTDGQNRLTIECLPNDAVQWVLSTELGKRIVRTAGDCDVDQLLACLVPYNPFPSFLPCL